MIFTLATPYQFLPTAVVITFYQNFLNFFPPRIIWWLVFKLQDMVQLGTITQKSYQVGKQAFYFCDLFSHRFSQCVIPGVLHFSEIDYYANWGHYAKIYSIEVRDV